MGDTNQEVEVLFDSLSTAAKNKQHKKTLKFTDEILKLIPGDEDALKCKVVALINIADYDGALRAISQSSQNSRLQFYKSYCLYKLSKFQEAVAALQAVPDEEPGALELEAQLHYKLGNNTDCIDAYKKFLQTQQAGSIELKVNILAGYVAAGLSSEVPSVMSTLKATSKQSFDIGFNWVCALVQDGKFEAAETELKQVMKLARETLLNEDDMTEEEIEKEMAPILVQMGFILARLGRFADATLQYDRVLKGQADKTEAAVAANNSIADGMLAHAAPHQKKFCSTALKKLDALLDKADNMRLQPDLEVGLSAEQKMVLHVNRALLAIMAGKLDQAAQISSLLQQQYPTSPVVTLVQASVFAKSNKLAEGDALLESFVKQQPETADDAMLMRVQLALEAGNQQAAMQLLASMQQSAALHSSPALLATRCKLHEQAGDFVGTEMLLEQLLDVLEGSAREQCLQQLISLKLQLGKTSEAATQYQQLQQTGLEQSTRAQVLAKLVRATAALDAGAPMAYGKDIPKGRPMSEAELDQLEEQMRSSAPAYLSKKHDTDGDIAMEPKKKKRKKKPKYPKNFDPENPGPPPDPERWLPKWQRTGYKKSRRRREAGNVKGSQGAGKVDESLDRTKAMDVDRSQDSKAAGRSGRSGKGKGKR